MIFIIARFPKLDLGHYWTFDGYLRSVLYENDLKFVFINPESLKANLEDTKTLQVALPPNAYFEIANDENFITNSVEFIKNKIEKNLLTHIIILIPWLPQFDSFELNLLTELESRVKVTYVGLTVLTGNALRRNTPGFTRYQHEEFFLTKKSRLMWVSDFPTGKYVEMEWIRKMPDFAETSIVKSRVFEYDLSFFGQLSSHRGLFEILMISFFNPWLKVRIKGYGYKSRRIFQPWRKHIFRYSSWQQNPLASVLFNSISLLVSPLRYLPNIYFSPKPFEMESDLDEAIGETRVMFYCPKFPHGSGLTNKSLAAGVPVLWHGWDGVAFELLNERYPKGYFKYHEIFIPGRIHRKLKLLPVPASSQTEMRESFVREILELKNFN